MIARSIANHTAPLCFMPDGKLVCYQRGDIVVYDDDLELQRHSLFDNKKERLLGRSKLLSRFLRLGIRSAVAVDDSLVILSIGNRLYELNISNGELSKGFSCGDGVRPLSFASVINIKGVDDGIYFGGYVRNFEKKPVRIYHRKGVDNWETIYTFSQNEINHVHTIVPDTYRKCLWIFTGDFGEASAIWRATDHFHNVERVVCGDQKWRGCVAFATPDGLLYATDAPYAKNHICLLRNDGTLTNVGVLSGSCIYGCQWKDKYVFSTAVEADGRNETTLRLLFGWKKGAGIQDYYARIYLGDINNGFSEAYREKKDILPFIFQFGVFKFPQGLNDSDTLFFQPVATHKNDLCLMGLNVNE